MKVVVGTDFSESSGRAVEWAVELIRRRGGTLHLVHSVYVPPEVQLGAGWWSELHAAARERAGDVLRRIEAQGVEVELDLVDEHPVTAILACADRVGADLITTGAHGSQHLVHLGSVAERVARLASCPVLTCVV